MNRGSCPLYGCTCLTYFKESKNLKVENYTQSKECLYCKRFCWKSLLQRNSDSTKALTDYKSVFEQTLHVGSSTCLLNALACPGSQAGALHPLHCSPYGLWHSIHSWWQWCQLPLQQLYSPVWLSTPKDALPVQEWDLRGSVKVSLLCAWCPGDPSWQTSESACDIWISKPRCCAGLSACFLTTVDSEGSMLPNVLGMLSTSFCSTVPSPRGSTLLPHSAACCCNPSLIGGPVCLGTRLGTLTSRWPSRCLWVPITWALFQVDTRPLMSMQLREWWSSCSSEFSPAALTRSLATIGFLSHPDMDTDGNDEVNGILHQEGSPFSLHSQLAVSYH